LSRPALSASRRSSHKFHTSSCKSGFVCSFHCPAFSQIKRSGRASVLRKLRHSNKYKASEFLMSFFFISVPMDLDAVNYKQHSLFCYVPLLKFSRFSH
jgi:hypothetical protein